LGCVPHNAVSVHLSRLASAERGAGHKKRQQAAARAKRVRAERARTFAAAKDEASGSGAPAAAS
jgi:hypothetical protein